MSLARATGSRGRLSRLVAMSEAWQKPGTRPRRPEMQTDPLPRPLAACASQYVASSVVLRRVALAPPIEDHFACPESDAGLGCCVIEEGLEVLDPVRHAANVWMYRETQYLSARDAFLIKPVELVAGALQENIGMMMLHHHHRDVVQFHRIGKRHQPSVRSCDFGRLVIIDPVTDVLDSGLGQQVGRLVGLGQPWAEPAYRSLAGEFLD